MRPTRKAVAEYLFRLIQRKGMHLKLPDEERLIARFDRNTFDKTIEWEQDTYRNMYLLLTLRP